MKLLQSKYLFSIVGLIFFSFYLIGTFNPDNWWGTHFLAFFPTPFKYSLLTFGAFLVLSSFSNVWEKYLKKIVGTKKLSAFIIIPLITILMGFAFYLFPIFEDHYGDSFEYDGMLGVVISSISDVSLNPLFSFDINPSAGRLNMSALVNLISYTFQINYYQVFVAIGILCGSLFAFFWLLFVHRNIQNTLWKTILAIAGLTAPALQIFFGHVEMYAPTFLILEAWMILLITAIETRRKWILYLLIPLTFIGLKIHQTVLLLIPIWLIVFLAQTKATSKFTEKIFSLKGITVYILAPIFALGLILYFFILGEYNDPRTLEGAHDFERIFLPIVSPAPPLDRYNLQSFNHIFDFFNAILLWSPVALIVIIGIVIGHKNKVNWEKPSILMVILALVLYTGFFFAVNPLLSMPIDWDLFVIPTPLLLILAALVVREVEDKKVPAFRLFPIAIAMALLSSSFFITNAFRYPYSQRLESLSIRIFKTYHIWADRYLRHAVNLDSSPLNSIKRNEAVIAQLRPYALVGKDLHYAQMLYDNALRHININKDIRTANNYLLEASQYFPGHKSITLYLMQTNFQLGKFKNAYENALQLSELKHLSEEKSLEMLIHCALAAELYDQAEAHSSSYLELAADDSTIVEVHQRLVNKDNVEQLVNLFSNPNNAQN